MGIPVYWSLTIPPPSESTLKPTLKQTRPTPSSIRRHTHTNILRRPLYSEIVRHPPDDDGSITSFFPQRQPQPPPTQHQRRESERENDRPPQPGGRDPAEYFARLAGPSFMRDFLANPPYRNNEPEIYPLANLSADTNNHEVEPPLDNVPQDARSRPAIPNDPEETHQSTRHDRIGYVARLLRENNMGSIENPETRERIRQFLAPDPQSPIRGPTAPLVTESPSPNATSPVSTDSQPILNVGQYINWMADPSVFRDRMPSARTTTTSLPTEQTRIVQRSPEPIPMSESSYESTMFDDDDDSEDERAMTLRLRELADRRLEELHRRQAGERGGVEPRPRRPMWIMPHEVYRNDDEEEDDYEDEDPLSIEDILADEPFGFI
jgi:hypothetical protein